MTPELLSELKTKVSNGMLAFETALDTLYQAAHDFIAGATAAAATDPATTTDPAPATTTDPAAAVTTNPAAVPGAAPTPLELAVAKLDAAKLQASGDEATDQAAIAAAQAEVDALSVPTAAA